MRALYPVCQVAELAAGYRDTTRCLCPGRFRPYRSAQFSSAPTGCTATLAVTGAESSGGNAARRVPSQCQSVTGPVAPVFSPDAPPVLGSRCSMAVGPDRSGPHPSSCRAVESGADTEGAQGAPSSPCQGHRGVDGLTGVGSTRCPWSRRSRSGPLCVLATLSTRAGRATAELRPAGRGVAAYFG